MLSSSRDLKTWYHAKPISIWCGLHAGFKKSVNKWKKILPECILRSSKKFKNLRKSKDTLILKRFHRSFFLFLPENLLVPSTPGGSFLPVVSTHCISSRAVRLPGEEVHDLALPHGPSLDRLHVVMNGLALPV